MKILLFSSTPWNTDNSFGNTYSNLFEGISNIEFANVYCSFGYPKNNVSAEYYQIDEKSLLKSIFSSSEKTGRRLQTYTQAAILSENESRREENIKRKRWWIFFLARNLLWYFGRWHSADLERFVDEAQSELIFVPLYHSTYLNRIVLYLKRKTGLRMVAYVSDDIYTFKRFSFSLYFWLNHLAVRRIIRKVVNQCEYLYVVSDIQKREYEKIFGKECRILVKGGHFDDNQPSIREIPNQPIRMVFTGNIGAGRWKSLAILARALDDINRSEVKIQLYIYTATPMTKQMTTTLTIRNSVFLMGSVPAEQIPDIQNNADILVHVESMKLRDRLQVRHSISTKIVDYFCRARCIFAIGTLDVASIDYLVKNEAAIVATSEKMVGEKLRLLINNPAIMSEYAQKAWDCGKRNHQIDIIQKNLYNDLQKLVKAE